jgi:hypothetical protein
MSDENKIRDVADAVKGVVEAMPIYQDVVQPAAKEIGQALQTVAKTVHIALAPISALVWGYDKIKDFVTSKVAEKLQETPTERIQPPSPHVAGPALEALRYTGHEEDLRELFANLLATSLDSATSKEAHPSFVEMIKQITPDEAKILHVISDGRAIPVITIRSDESEQNRAGVDAFRHLCMIGIVAECRSPELTPNYLENLVRLGLLDLRYDSTYKNKELYDPIKEHHQFDELMNSVKKSGRHPRIVEGRSHLTELGKMFCKACVISRV